MLRAGIPAWHLPEDILEAEIAKLLDLGGIEIRCGVRVGDDPADRAASRWTTCGPATTPCSSPSARTWAVGWTSRARRPAA